MTIARNAPHLVAPVLTMLSCGGDSSEHIAAELRIDRQCLSAYSTALQ